VVAYNFNSAFVEDVAAGRKRQTVRRHRKRHVRPGEFIQLFTGMRTRHCRKLTEIDPVCLRVDEIEIDVAVRGIAAMRINGIPLSKEDQDAFARADGFGGFAFPLQTMGHWWRRIHGGGTFRGVVIIWSDPLRPH
jgi:uncharacterized protein YqfB (UPF0267 family)